MRAQGRLRRSHGAHASLVAYGPKLVRGGEEEDDSGAHASVMWEKERGRGILGNMKIGWFAGGSNT